MEVLFAFSIENYTTQQKIINRIRRFSLAIGNTFQVDWVHTVENNLANFNKFKTRRLFIRSLEALKTADVVLIEGSFFNFETASLLHEAIAYKKPVLVLVDKEQKDLDTMPKFQLSEYVEVREYTIDTYEEAIQNFIEINRNEPLSRFNIMLERKQKNYLDWADRFYRQSKSEIIRNLINQRAQNDPNYPQK